MNQPNTLPFAGRRVLVVDDDPDLLLQMSMQLESLGFEVTTAVNATSAEALIGDLKLDVAVLDLMMEHEDSGFVLAWKLKRAFPGLPVLIVTAVSARTGMDFNAARREERSWIQADAVLTKPVRTEQIERELQRLLPQ